MAFDSDPNVLIESGGNTFNVATDAVVFSGATSHFQYMKLAFGPTGSVSIVSSTNGLPVNVIAGGITANLVGFCGAIQGIPGGTPVAVSGTVYATGISSAPVFVRTSSGYQVEITGGIPLSKSVDSVSVWGPNGVTWISSKLVNSSGTDIGNSANPMFVQISGATINAVINPTVGVTNSGSALFVQGLTAGVPMPTTVGNTVGINDTALLAGLTGLYAQLLSLNLGLATAMPTTFKTGRTTSTYPAVQQLDGGFTCGKGVSIKALSTNTDFIYIGNTGTFVGTSTGHALDPGDQIFMTVDNLNKIYISSASATQVVTFAAS